MKKMILSLLVIVAPAALAHVEPGVHKGITPEGQACEMTVARTYHLGGMHHPLNERVEVNVGGDDFLLQHPPVISLDQQMAYFDHDQFQSIIATPVGAKALVVKMSHTASFEGPTEFNLITHEYRQDKRSVLTCKLN